MHAEVRTLLDAIAAGDVEAMLASVTDDLVWENVPHGPVHGKQGLRDMLGKYLERCDQVRWDVITSAQDGDRSYLERVDRFWIDGVEYPIECNGVFVVRDGLVCEVRDYTDVGVWRARIGNALD